MTTKYNVGDDVLIEGVVESIYVETTDNKPVYNVRIKGTFENRGISFKEDDIYCHNIKNSEVKEND